MREQVANQGEGGRGGAGANITPGDIAGQELLQAQMPQPKVTVHTGGEI